MGLYYINYDGEFVQHQEIQDRLYEDDYVDFVDNLIDKYSLDTIIVKNSDIAIYSLYNDRIKLILDDWEYESGKLLFKFRLKPVNDIDSDNEYMQNYFAISKLVIDYWWYFEKIEQNHQAFYKGHATYNYKSAIFYSTYSSQDEVNTDEIKHLVEQLNKVVKEMSNKTLLHRTKV